jgi:hypothetical protein
MDVDADGSDSDRLPAGSGTSPFFQPYTSYRWAKRTATPSAYLGMLEERIKTHEAEAALKTTSAARKAELKAAIAQSRDGIDQLKRFSFLIGATDPFIVMPGGFAKAEGAKVGDYALVIHGESIYPALVGDVGPADKAGEASLRIAKEISGSANPMNRPVSDLKVTYLIFPGTSDAPWGPPDLDKIHERCDALVKEIGGAGVPLHKWENIIPPPATPTPSPTPTPTPAPEASPEHPLRHPGRFTRADIRVPAPERERIAIRNALRVSDGERFTEGGRQPESERVALTCRIALNHGDAEIFAIAKSEPQLSSPVATPLCRRTPALAGTRPPAAPRAFSRTTASRPSFLFTDETVLPQQTALDRRYPRARARCRTRDVARLGP